MIVLVTCPDNKSADTVSKAVLKEKLAACASTISGVKSKFWWKGKIDSSEEVLIIFKTKENLFKSLEKVVKDNHPYDVPEIIAIPIKKGSDDYLKWIDDETELS